MSGKKKILLLPFGLRETDLRLLKSICALSDGLARPYRFVCTEEPANLPTIWIVDEAAFLQWRDQNPNGAVSIVISTTGAPAGDEQVVRRPVTASRLLAALDAVADKQANSTSELVIGDSSPVPDAASAVAGGGLRYARYTALVVDDSPTIQKQIELGLRLNDVAAVCVDNGEAALAALEDKRFDVVFLDVILSGSADGYQICKSIKKDPANKHIPVVMLTSKGSTFDRVRGSMVGCDTYLTKPVDTATFNAIVTKYLPELSDEPASNRREELLG